MSYCQQLPCFDVALCCAAPLLQRGWAPVWCARSGPLSECAHVPLSQIDQTGWVACGGGVNRLQPEMHHGSGWGLETTLTFLLVFTVLAATDAQRATDTAHLPVSPSTPCDETSKAC